MEETCEYCKLTVPPTVLAHCESCGKLICPACSYVSKNWKTSYCPDCWDDGKIKELND